MRKVNLMPLRHTLLGLLHWQPMHGYRLRKHAKEYSWIYPMTNASIYPALHGLENDGFISHHSEIHNGRARKVYEITDSGRAELRSWLIDPTPHGMTFRDHMLLKIAMQTDDTIRYARLWIEEALLDLRKEYDHYRNELEADESLARYTRVAMQYGLEMVELRVRFFEQVLETARQPSSSVHVQSMTA
jgi:DNA-binding PadR family transcriptional regulator